MNCMNCGNPLPENSVICVSCGKTLIPDGFLPDGETGLYSLAANGTDPQTGAPIKVVTRFNPADGSYSQETFPVAPESVPVAEPAPTSASEPAPAIASESVSTIEPVPTAEPESAPEPVHEPTPEPAPAMESMSAPEAAPTFEPAPEQAAEPAPKKKKRRVGKIIFTSLLVVALLSLAGLAGVRYYFGYPIIPERITDFVKSTEIQNITAPPEGAAIPAFLPMDPLPPQPESEIVNVPDAEVSKEIPEPPEVQDTLPPTAAIPVNYYPPFANINAFYARAMQDESNLYYLPPDAGYALTNAADLMRVPIGSGKPEYVESFWPGTASVYSFTLYESDIIVCARKPDAPTYGYYRAPKSGGNAEFLFEQDTPSHITVHDGKLFMLLESTRKLGIFDLKSDTHPTLIDINTELADADGVYLPEFSIADGYLYYGVSYNGGERVNYMRRSLYTGETVVIFNASGNLHESWVVNPVFDDDGNVYYGQFNRGTNVYSFKTGKLGSASESLLSFSVTDGIVPFAAVYARDGVLAMAGTGNLRKYTFDSFGAGAEHQLEGRPYAVTNDYLITSNGVYLIADFSWIPFEAPDAPDSAPSQP